MHAENSGGQISRPVYWATVKVFRKREQLESQQCWRKKQNSFIRLKWERRERCGGVGRKERKKQNKTRITNILTNEKVVVLQTEVNSGLLGG